MKKVPIWVWIVGPIALVLMCCGGFSALVVAKDTPDRVSSAPTAGPAEQQMGEPTQAAVAAPAPPAPAQPVTVVGSGKAVVSIDAVLTGTFKVDYSFGSWCGIVDFLNAVGNDAAKWMEGINDCSGNTDAPLTGSTVVHLKDATMVQVDNTRGTWSLTFTPVG